MTRYRLTELTPSGYGRRIITERLSVARNVIDALGGEWRVERQYHWANGWHRDGGRALWTETGIGITAAARAVLVELNIVRAHNPTGGPNIVHIDTHGDLAAALGDSRSTNGADR